MPFRSDPLLTADSPATRLATRLSFLVAGFGYGCWAPLVPLTKLRFGIDDHILGLLILCIGIGSITAMVVTGMLATRVGSKPILLGSGFGFALMLGLLPLAGTTTVLACILFGFGATLGALDVAMNLHAVEVEKGAARPMMSGFHALFSVGGFAGAAFMTFLLSLQVATLMGTAICAILMAVAMAMAAPRLLDTGATPGGPMFALPRGVVLVLAVLAGVTFLVEGALLDWSALLITETQLVPVAQGGIGYMIFSIAMTVGRFSGDWLSSRLGDLRTMLWVRHPARAHAAGAGAVRLCLHRPWLREHRAGAVSPRRRANGHAGGPGRGVGDDRRLCGHPGRTGHHRFCRQGHRPARGVLDAGRFAGAGTVVRAAGDTASASGHMKLRHFTRRARPSAWP
jgi:MFS family permease